MGVGCLVDGVGVLEKLRVVVARDSGVVIVVVVHRLISCEMREAEMREEKREELQISAERSLSEVNLRKIELSQRSALLGLDLSG